MTRHQKARALLAGKFNRSEEAWRKYLPTLDQLSRQMRSRAISHRGFDNGTVSLAWGWHRDPVIVGGANHKPHKGERRHRAGDYCGEMESIWAARRMHCSEIIGMVVTCPHQPDEVSGRDFGVTVSCYYCRIEFRVERRKSKSPLKGHTRLRFNHPTDRSLYLNITVDKFLAMFPNDPPWVLKRGGT
ncbi:hypothetical protein A2853_00355 [Candidatus Kaiserbacteria bacterium RIFCSPHIGHO2_01_FULL_55_17]|uniref:Uncharacterized protein n=1 Tax=Candidatus Kaiserbacteria bacterium RIFCSPHIGHO2_01_FULL_55_17 TaxID=1798484 RepID=A0A1F6DAL0_9BACT|nr:MAG: hypothetical protein A2853_00355 [Candidatus Kaiserbacteria bacterium RIFCSPHIGHO2_01_FULL_55_17]